MSEKIILFINKFHEYLPSVGGATGAITQVKQFTFLPTWDAVLATVTLTIIGAVLGYLVKLFLDIICRNIKKKYGI